MRNVLLIGLALLLGSLWWNVHRGCNAYYATPDIEPFFRFVEPSIDKNESKVSYLFSPTIVAAIFTLVWLSVNMHWFDSRYGERGTNTFAGRLFVAGFFMFMMHLPVAINSDNAMAAAHRINWQGKTNPTALVDTVCAAAYLRF